MSSCLDPRRTVRLSAVPCLGVILRSAPDHGMLEKAKLQLQQYLNDDEPNRWHACALAITTVLADSVAAADPGSRQCTHPPTAVALRIHCQYASYSDIARVGFCSSFPIPAALISPQTTCTYTHTTAYALHARARARTHTSTHALHCTALHCTHTHTHTLVRTRACFADTNYERLG